MGRKIHPADPGRVARLGKTIRPFGQIGAALRQALPIGRCSLHRQGCLQRLLELLNNTLQRLRPALASCHTSPLDLLRHACLGLPAGGSKSQVASAQLQPGGQLLPGAQPAGVLKTRLQKVAGQIDDLATAQAGSQKLQAHFHQLVGLVKDRYIHGRQQLGHLGLAQGNVSEEQMVVDHDDICSHGLAPRPDHVAAGPLRAVTSETVLSGGGDQGQHR